MLKSLEFLTKCISLCPKLPNPGAKTHQIVKFMAIKDTGLRKRYGTYGSEKRSDAHVFTEQEIAVYVLEKRLLNN